VSDHGFGTYPKARAIHSSTPFDGMHTLNGMLVAAGPEIRSGQKLARRLTHYDLVPTLLYRLGLPITASLPGSVATELFETDFNNGRARLVRRDVSTGRSASDVPKDTPFEDDEIERLRSLGYVQ
ncbi:MAG: hypothetical protein AAFQ82_17440, partial [Myxococcota bacterium]